tara:strand:- start:80 stop:1285 length:1206 start_codon:yes stop_codon:yes gene_type:complete
MKTNEYGIGSIIQMYAKGPQDLDLYSNGKTFFETDYKTHTLFVPWYENLTLFKDANFGEIYTFVIPNQRKLVINKMYFNIKLPNLDSNVKWKNHIGYRILKNVKILVNSEVLNEYDGKFLYIYSQLNTEEIKLKNISEMTGGEEINGNKKELYIEIPFFFNQFFPILGLDRTEIKIEVEFEKLENLCINELSTQINKLVNFKITPTQDGVKTSITPFFNQFFSNGEELTNKIDLVVFIDYCVLLEEQEISMLMTKHQSYLYYNIETFKDIITNDIYTTDLPFNIPIKQIIFVFESDDYIFEPFDNFSILLNSSETQFSRDSKYFHLVQSFYYNKRIPDKKIYSYSFCIDPGNLHPSGSVHFGKLAKKSITIKGAINKKLILYAIGYNVLEISNGECLITFN